MSAQAQTATTAATSTATKSAKQRKREAADAKLAASAPESRKPIYAVPPKTEAAPAQEQAATTPKAEGHNSNKSKQIAMNTVGPKRELAYAVVGLFATLDRLAIALAVHDGAKAEVLASDPNVLEARAALVKHGYGNLRPRAERIEALKASLQEAAAAGDLARVTDLAKQMKAVQDGRAD